MDTIANECKVPFTSKLTREKPSSMGYSISLLAFYSSVIILTA